MATLGATQAYDVLSAAASRDGFTVVAYEDDVHPYADLALGRVDAVVLDHILAERGVRMTQVYFGGGQPWDDHSKIEKNLKERCPDMDKACAALIKDLKQRGLLEDTIVLWTTEFGRMPCSQGGLGRDHNPAAFTSWLAGGGIKGGTSYGESDEWSYKAAVNPTYCYDLHATALHLLGLDHEKLGFYHNGINRRLTDVHGHVIRSLLA